jgi:thioredoxin reductase (NADPH)
MPKPILLVAVVDPDALATVAEALDAEFGRDFRVERAASTREALERLEGCRREDRAVALVIAGEDLGDGTGVDLLGRVAERFPGALRALATPGAEAEQPAEGGAVEGPVQLVLYRPWSAVEECLYPMVRTALADRPEAEADERDAVLRVIGDRWSPESHEIKDFLARNHVPYLWLDVDRDAEALALTRRLGVGTEEQPVVLFADGSHLTRPSDADLAARIGLSTEAERAFYDLVIVGGGPAGLAAAVYGASEGLRTIIVEREAPGGQAGLSSRIENYLGFPKGLTGSDLARRAVEQAASFGAEILVAREAKKLRAEGPYRVVTLDDGVELYAYSVLLANGVSWRWLDLPRCAELTGAGIYYGAAAAEAPAFEGQDIILAGGGNSGGQAAVHLARYARSVTMVVPEASLEERMSKYLVDRIARAPNIEVRLGRTIGAVHGEERLTAVTLRSTEGDEEESIETGGLFVFIGAEPRTEWLGESVHRDEQGYVVCGAALRDRAGGVWPLEREPYLLETSMPGVFVAGDVRAESVKRIGSAVGEGSVAIQFVHQYLADL